MLFRKWSWSFGVPSEVCAYVIANREAIADRQTLQEVCENVLTLYGTHLMTLGNKISAGQFVKAVLSSSDTVPK